MIGEMPKFMDSPYFVDEPGNWHLKPGAPPEVVKEFEAYMKSDPSRSDGESTAKTFGNLLNNNK